MPGLLGKKIGMTSIYTEDGTIIPVTVLEVGPCKVYDIKTKEKDGYEALKLGFGTKKEKHVNKPEMGFFNKVNADPSSILREFRNFDINDHKVGDDLTLEIFQLGDMVKVSGKSKGKGFQGVIKRHGFSGVGGRTHGQHNRERAPGSIGSSSYPSRVFKGQRMGGRMGFELVTVSGLKVVKLMPEKNILMVRGALPGAINSIVEINK